MSATEDTPDAAGRNVDPQHAGQRQQDRWIFVEGPAEGSADYPCNEVPTRGSYSGNPVVIGQPGAGKTALHRTLLQQVTTKLFLPNPDARDDACYAALRLTDAEFRRVRIPRSA